MTAVKIKKVTAYPITTSLTGPTGTFSGQILKLTSVGLMCETEKTLAPGQQFTLNFTLPAFNKVIQTVVVVVKTYARYGGEPGKSTSHGLNEMHFRSLPEDQRMAIAQFVNTIKQR